MGSSKVLYKNLKQLAANARLHVVAVSQRLSPNLNPIFLQGESSVGQLSTIHHW